MLRKKSEKITVLMNGKFIFGLFGLVSLILLAIVGSLTVTRDKMLMGAFTRDLPPSMDNILGTDSQGRDIASVLVIGLGHSLELGFLAGSISVLLGAGVGIIAGYMGGATDDILKGMTDVFLIIPSWPLLVTLTMYVPPIEMSISMLAVFLAVFAWPWSARTIRSQVLSLRNRSFIDFAKLSDMGSMEIAFKEVLPNLLPYLGSTYAYSVSGVIMTEVGLEVVGVLQGIGGTLGGMIFWATSHGGFAKGMWWWIFPPVVCLILLFLSLQFLNFGLDEIYNPRLRKE